MLSRGKEAAVRERARYDKETVVAINVSPHISMASAKQTGWPVSSVLG